MGVNNLTIGGHYIQYSSSTFNLYENMNVGGNLFLNGGTLAMTLTSGTSRITATGSCTATGTTAITLNNGSIAPANQVLISAASGLGSGSLANFSLTATGTPGSLTANGTQLMFSAPPTLVTPAALTITAPVGGATPSTTISTGSTEFTAALAWDGSPATFGYSTAYTATVTLTAEAGYTFSGDYGNVSEIAGFTVNTIAPTTWTSNSGTQLVFKVAFPATGAAPTLATLTVGLTAGDGIVTLAPQTAEAGYAFYYNTTLATVAAPAYGAAIGTIGGVTAYTTPTDISGANGTAIFVQVYKVETGGNTVVGFGEASATPTAAPLTYVVAITSPAVTSGGTYNFANATVGYAPLSATTFTIRNNGTGAMTDLAVDLSGISAGSYTLDDSGINATLAPNGTTTFTIKPNNALPAATYTATVTITDANLSPDYTFTVNFVVGTVVTPPTKSVTVGIQNTALTAGTIGTTTFAAATANIASGQAGAITWYTTSGGTTVATAPAGVSASVTNVSGNAATVTMTTSAAAAAGSYWFRITIDGTTSNVGTLTIGAPATVITITGQPANTNVSEGGTGNLSVTANVTGGATPGYQWYSNETASNTGGTAISGATSAQFAIPTGTAGTYYYYCVVSATGAASVTSNAATVTVAAAPVPPVPVFSGLADSYTAGSAAVTLKVIGEGSAALTVFKVNGTAASEFNPATAGTYLIEASSADGKLRIWKYVRVN